MPLAHAILHVLDTTPRPVTAEIVLTFLPGFYSGPELARARSPEARLQLVNDRLETLQALDEVTAIADHHLGRLWKITPNGKAALR